MSENDTPFHEFQPSLRWLLSGLGNLIAPRKAFDVAARTAEAKMELSIAAVQGFRSLPLKPEVLFVWVPKAAGTSIHYWLSKELGGFLIKNPETLEQYGRERKSDSYLTFGHMNIDKLIEFGLLSPLDLHKTRSFAIVRNPYDRLISLFRYAVTMRAIPSRTPLGLFFSLVERQSATPGAYNWAGLSHASPMVNWVVQENWNGPKDVVKIEALSEALPMLAKAFGISSKPKRLNVSIKDTSERFPIGRTLANRIGAFYERDFSTFGYSFDPKHSATVRFNHR